MFSGCNSFAEIPVAQYHSADGLLSLASLQIYMHRFLHRHPTICHPYPNAWYPYAAIWEVDVAQQPTDTMFFLKPTLLGGLIAERFIARTGRFRIISATILGCGLVLTVGPMQPLRWYLNSDSRLLVLIDSLVAATIQIPAFYFCVTVATVREGTVIRQPAAMVSSGAPRDRNTVFI
jgi:hypothetical protein